MKNLLSLIMIILSLVFFLNTDGAARKKTQKKKDKIDYQSFVFIEAEDAIVTNFTNKATAFFFASNKHTLQLSKEPSGEKNEFYAKYVFFNTIDREYDIWVGATPPGGKRNPYMSPFYISFDEGTRHKVTSESVRYSNYYTHGGFYYYKALSGRIPYGQHSFQIIVKDGRTYDKKYVLYIDNIIIVPKNKNIIAYQNTPDPFPVNLRPRKRFAFPGIKRINYRARIETLELYARCLAWAGKYEESSNIYKTLVSRKRGDNNFNIGLILTLLWSGKPREAYKKLDDLIVSPRTEKNIKTLLMKFSAQEASWGGDHGKAAKYYEEILKINKSDEEAIIGLGNVYTWTGEIDKATVLYENSLKKYGGSVSMLFSIADNYEKNKQYSHAIVMYEKLMKRVPDNFSVYQKLAALYARTGKEVKAAKTLALGEKLKAVQKVTKGELTPKKDTAKEEIIAGYEKAVMNDYLNIQKHLYLQSAYEWYGLEDMAVKRHKIILALKLYNHLVEAENMDKDLLMLSAKINYLYANGKKLNAVKQNDLKNIAHALDRIERRYNEFNKKTRSLKWELDTGEIKSRIKEAFNREHFLYRRLMASLDFFELNGASANAHAVSIKNNPEIDEKTIAPFIFLGSGDIKNFTAYVNSKKYTGNWAKLIKEMKNFSGSYVPGEKAKGLSSDDLAAIKAIKVKADNLKKNAYKRTIITYYSANIDQLKKLGNYYIYLKDPYRAQIIFKELIKLQPDHIDANLQLADIYRWDKQYYRAVKFYEHILELEPGHKRALLGRKEVLSVFSPELYIYGSLHSEPIVDRWKIGLSGDYILNDYFRIRGFYGYGSVTDTLGFTISSIYSKAKSTFSYHEAGADLTLSIFPINIVLTGGYYARNYRGEVDLEYLSQYSSDFTRNITNNYYANLGWNPASMPFSLFVHYEYADVIELTQSVKLGLFYHYINAVTNLSLDFLPFFPFNRLSYYGFHEYKMISDENTLLKTYNKGIFNILNLPFSGMKLNAGAISIYEDSTFNIYPEDNEIYRKQANVPYYAPMELSTYGGFIEWIHDLKSKLGFYFEYLIGINYFQTSEGAAIYNPLVTLKGNVNKLFWELTTSYIYSKSYQTYESGQAFKSYDVFLKVGRKFYTDYQSKKKSSGPTQ